MRILKDTNRIKKEVKQAKLKKDMKDKIAKIQNSLDKKSSITLRLSKETKEQLKSEALEDGRSLANFILQKLKS